MQFPPTPFAHLLESAVKTNKTKTRALDDNAKNALAHGVNGAKQNFIEFLKGQGVEVYYIERVETIEAETLVGWLDGGLDLLIKNIGEINV